MDLFFSIFSVLLRLSVAGPEGPAWRAVPGYFLGGSATGPGWARPSHV